MREWILNLFGLKPTSDPLEELECLQTYSSDDLRVRILVCPLPCGHPAFWIEESCFDALNDRWLPMALYREFHLGSAIELLERARDYIDTIPIPACEDCKR